MGVTTGYLAIKIFLSNYKNICFNIELGRELFVKSEWLKLYLETVNHEVKKTQTVTEFFVYKGGN